jgi:hypothetical protein
VFGAAAILFGASAALAQPAPGMWSSWQVWAGPGSGIVLGPGAMSRVVVVDANGDGYVDEAEMTQHMRTVFLISDTSRDGLLSLPEFLAVRTATGQILQQPQLAEIEKARIAHFRQLDLNSDDALSPGEYYAGAKAIFRAADKAEAGRLPWTDYSAIDGQ